MASGRRGNDFSRFTVSNGNDQWQLTNAQLNRVGKGVVEPHPAQEPANLGFLKKKKNTGLPEMGNSVIYYSEK